MLTKTSSKVMLFLIELMMPLKKTALDLPIKILNSQWTSLHLLLRENTLLFGTQLKLKYLTVIRVKGFKLGKSQFKAAFIAEF